MTERFIRHGNYLTVVTIVDDPIYLEEPFIRTTNWVLNPDQEVRRTQFDVVDEVAVRRRGEVPHYLRIARRDPQADRVRVQVQAAAKGARGGAATTYPDAVETGMSQGRPTGSRPSRDRSPGRSRRPHQGKRAHDRRRRRKHHRAGRRRRCPRDRHRHGRRGAEVLAAIRQYLRQTDPHRHQHARAPRSHRRERANRRCRPLARRERAGQLRARAGDRAGPGARERPQAHERAIGRAVAQTIRRVADGNVLRRGQGALLQRRGDPADSSARSYRRRRPRLLSPLGCRRERRSVFDH